MELTQPKIYVTEFSIEACLKYVEQLNNITSMFGPEQPIVIQIESYGGSVDGFTIIYDALKSSENPIITYTSGMAMSAGAVLFAAVALPNNRIVGENATIMIHEVQTGAIGDIKDVREELKLSERLNQYTMGLLVKAMGLKSIKELRTIMVSKSESHQMYLTAKEAVELKIADTIGSVKLSSTIGFNVMVVPPTDQDAPEISNEDMLEFIESTKKKKLPKVPQSEAARKKANSARKKANRKAIKEWLE